jgi:hypothetical protein
MKNNKRNTINKHHQSYDKATEHALRAIFEDVIIKIDGQVYEYDKQRNELHIKDFYKDSIYKPEFSKDNLFCNPFKELVRQEVCTNE